MVTSVEYNMIGKRINLSGPKIHITFVKIGDTSAKYYTKLTTYQIKTNQTPSSLIPFFQKSSYTERDITFTVIRIFYDKYWNIFVDH